MTVSDPLGCPLMKLKSIKARIVVFQVLFLYENIQNFVIENTENTEDTEINLPHHLKSLLAFS